VLPSENYINCKEIGVASATVTSKGQVTIPAEIREQLKIEPGDQLIFFTDFNGALQVHVRRPRPGAGRGMFKVTGPAATLADIDEAIADAVAEETAPASRRRKRGRAA
jgi:antitoxin PrlF